MVTPPNHHAGRVCNALAFVVIFLLLGVSNAIAQGLSVNGNAAPSPVSVNAGSAATVQFANGSGQAGEWIGLFARDAASGATHWLDWKFPSGNRTNSAGSPSGTLTFAMPVSAGDMEFRWYSASGTLIATSGPITNAGNALAGFTLALGLNGRPTQGNGNGSGADQDLVLNQPVNCSTFVRTGRSTADCIATRIAAASAAGATSISVQSTMGFAAGDEIAVVQSVGTGAGNNEYAVVTAATAGTISVASPLQNAYGSTGAQVVRVPNYAKVVLGGTGAARNVGWSWQSAGITTNGNGLLSTNCEYFCAAVSDLAIHNGDGYAEFTVGEYDGIKYAGLGDAGPIYGSGGVAFGFWIQNGSLFIWHRGANVFPDGSPIGSYAAGDVLRVGIVSGQVKYYKNGTLLYTAATTPAYPLRFVGEFFGTGYTLQNIKMQTLPAITASAWNGTTGGVLSFRVRDSLMASPEAAIYLGASVWRPTACTYTLNPNLAGNLPALGASGVAAVTTQPGCSWQASSSAQWLSVSPASGVGSGSFAYTATANPSSQPRSATMIGALVPVTVTQDGGCALTFSPGEGTSPFSGGAGEVSVTAPSPSCAWTAASNTSWLTVTSGGAQTGSGTVSYSVTENPTGDPREGTITFAAQQFKVTQAPNCQFAVNVNSVSAPFLGSNTPIQVDANGATCSWSASSPVPWITFGSSGGVGDGTIALVVATSHAQTTREATVTVAGHSIAVSQAPNPLTISVNGTASPNPIGLGAGVTATVTVTNAPGNAADWVGIFPASPEIQIDANAWIDWKFLNDLRTQPLSGLTTATMTFTLPASLADLEFRFYGATGVLHGRSGIVTTTPPGVAGLTVAFGLQGHPLPANANGDGADGPLVVTKPANCYSLITDSRTTPHCVAATTTAAAASGATTIQVSSTVGFAANDEILIAQSGVNPSQYEYARLASVTSGSLIVQTALVHAYGTGAAVIRVPNFSTVLLGGGGGVSPVGWSYVSAGVSTNGNALTMSDCPAFCGAVSDFAIRSGDGYVEFTPNVTAGFKYAGLGDAGPLAGTSNVAHGFWMQNGSLFIQERGINVLPSGGPVDDFAAGDVLRVEIEGGLVKYLRNGTLLHTSGVAPVYPLRFVGEGMSTGGGLQNITLAAAPAITGRSLSGSPSILAMRVRDAVLTSSGASIYLGSQSWKPDGCTFSVSGLSSALPAAPGTASASVTATPGCSWSAATTNEWIEISSGAPGHGSGTLTIALAANSGYTRLGSIVVAGQTVTVTQLGACSVSMSPATALVPKTAGNHEFAVTTSLESCTWTPASNANWITVSDTTLRTGSGGVAFSVAQNPNGEERSATISVANQVFTVTQAPNCQFTVTANGGSFLAAGATRTATIDANGPACAWTAVTSTPWLSLSPSSGVGDGAVQFTVASWTSTAQRTGVMTIADQQILVGQYGILSELIKNGDFEQAFHDADPNYGTGKVALDWSNGANTNFQTAFAMGGVPGDYEQQIDGAGVNDGIAQHLSVPPGTEYELSADLFIASGRAKLFAQPYGQNPFEVQSVPNRMGAHRLRLRFTQNQHAYGPDNLIVAILGTEPGTNVRIDRVSLRPVIDVLNDEVVANGNFEAGFYPVPIDGQSSGDIGDGWRRYGTSSSAVTFASNNEGTNWLQQSVTGANAGDGVSQIVSVVPGRTYLLRANVSIGAVAARIGIGPVGAPATHTVLTCGGNDTPVALSMLYTPPPGQTSVTVSIASDWQNAGFKVDEVSLMPTTLSFVHSGGIVGTCAPRHTLTFEIHDATTLERIEGALVEISPNWGNGPARTTYPDGTISYLVGADNLSFVVSKDGYVSQGGALRLEGTSTLAVSLVPVSATTPYAHWAVASGTSASSVCTFGFTLSFASPTLAYLAVATDSQCAWNAIISSTQVDLSPSSGVGPAVVTVTLSESLILFGHHQIDIEIAGYTITLADKATSQVRFLLGWLVDFIKGLVGCNGDNPSWLCSLTISIRPPAHIPLPPRSQNPGGGGGDVGGTPSLIGPPSTIRGDVGLWQVTQAQGWTFSKWKFQSTNGTVTVNRSSSGHPSWAGALVTSGTISVEARRGNQVIPLSLPALVTPRTSWSTAPVSPEYHEGQFQRSRNTGDKCTDMVPVDPDVNRGGSSGMVSLCVTGYKQEAQIIRRIDDQGPNHRVMYLRDFDDTMHFDWALHSDVANEGSDFFLRQLGTFAPLNTVACANPQAPPGNGGFISGTNFKAGVTRHEVGDSNSHWADYVHHLAKDEVNPKRNMEGLVDVPQSSPTYFLATVQRKYLELVQALERFASNYSEPCGAECTADCQFFNGFLNVVKQ